MDTRTVPLDDVRALMARATGDEKHEESTTSTLDALWVLYERILRIDPASPEGPDRDRFILGKGHGPAAFIRDPRSEGLLPGGLAGPVPGARGPPGRPSRPYAGA